MRVFRVPADLEAPGTVRLDADATHYVLRVHRLDVGQHVTLFDPVRAVEAHAILLSAGKAGAELQVQEIHPASGLPRRPLWLLQALAKGDKLDQVVRDTTTLGVTDILPVHCARSVVGRDAVTRSRLERWRRIAVQACRQCGRGDLPAIHQADDLAAALAIVPKGLTRLCLDTGGTVPLRDALRSAPAEQGFAVLVGPEGGLQEGEVRLAGEFGFAVVKFGDLVLRTETAPAAVLGALTAWLFE